uniref:Endolytic murein transglycosylase n=1 Tax=uncultured Bacteroidota bacterium TaxID=152509 RepID=H5SNX4_9BACT|nr:aminodeoxychorismate lyase [uncultured Bacteroidetes bacterium]
MVAAFLLVGGVGCLLQLTAPVYVSGEKVITLPFDLHRRREAQAEVAALFPRYTLWHWWARYAVFPAGRYTVREGELAVRVWDRFRRGLQAAVRLYVRPMRGFGGLAGLLGRNLAHDSTTWALAFQSYPWHEIGFDTRTWPLVFLPDVYEVYWTVSPSQLIDRMYKNYQRFWTAERKEKARAIGLTPVEVGILASIVEQETYQVSEMPLIAGVYLNRLRLGMPLQADPTVIFAVGNFSIARVTHRMLEVDSPYNTYKRRGLPPGPIGIPSPQSIDAVLNYQPSNYLYFCARPDGSGYHDFSVSYTEHLQKARRYQKALDRWLAQKR